MHFAQERPGNINSCSDVGAHTAGDQEAASGVNAYLVSIPRGPLLTHKQEIDLARRYRAGDTTARKELVERNLRLAVSVARKYQGRGLPLEDLIQEANTGLIQAVDKFDPDRGCRFSTHAIWWIRQAVGRAVANKGSVVRVPVYMSERRNRIAEAERRLSSELGRQPTDSETTADLAQNATSSRDPKTWTTDMVLTSKELTDRSRAVSLDEPRPSSDGEDVETPINHLPDPTEETEERAIHRQRVAEAHRRMSSLGEPLRTVIVRRYGLLESSHPATLGELAAEMGVSKERIRKLEAEAIHSLSDMSVIGKAS